MVNNALYRELEFKELQEAESKQRNEIIQRHGEEHRAFEDQKAVRQQEFKPINDRETQEEKDKRFHVFDLKLKGKISERQAKEITVFNEKVNLRIQQTKGEAKLYDTNKMQ